MPGKGFSVRTTEYRGSVLANICDEELIGKTVAEGKLKMHISEDYYAGEVIGEFEALRLIRTSSIINLAGKRSVALAVENKMGAREAVREIEDVPFLMIYKFSG
jgi:uncharacterized protein